MSATTAPDAGVRGGRLARPRGIAVAWPGPAALIALASLLLAAVSLRLQAAPSYDAWAWVIWGREIAHGSLITTGGPTWKPLPVMFTTLFAPFGAAAPGLWLLVARAGGLMSVGLAGLCSLRLARRGGAGRPAQLLAAGLAVAGMASLYQYLSGVAQGESEGLLAALLLLAILRHLDGKPRQALALAFAACLLRPEVWPFAALYALLLARRDRRVALMAIGGALLIGALWFLPELWGSGSLIRGVNWAQNTRPGSPAQASCPFCSELGSAAWPLVVMPIKIGLLLCIVAPLLARGRRMLAGSPVVLGLVGIGLVWILEEAVLTQIGFSGVVRYLTAPAALLIVAGAVGWAQVLSAPRVMIAAVSACLVLSALWFGQPPHLAAAMDTVRAQARVRDDLQTAVRRAGGASRVLACGPVQTNSSQVPLAAWTLDVPMRGAESGHGDVVIQTPSASDSQLEPALPSGGGYRLVAAAGAVRIFERC